MLRNATLSLAVLLVALGVSAQRRLSISGATGGGRAQPPATMPAGHHGLIEISGRPFGRRGFSRPFADNPYLGAWPYFDPGYYDYVDYSNLYQPPQIEQPLPMASAPPQVKQEPLPEPVLLELQGNQWVRVSSFKTSAEEPNRETNPQPTKPMPPAVLVFRDGHHEDISSYSIIGSVIHAKADYWASGSWTRSIQISDLDIPATLKENQERGVAFNLPSGPDEVVIRP